MSEEEKQAEAETRGLISSAVFVLRVLQDINFLPATTELDSFGLPSRATVL